jgi:lipoprotein-anchoring transpeptidase ErfK/SrfK
VPTRPARGSRMKRVALLGLAVPVALALSASASAATSTATTPGAPTATGAWTAKVLYPVVARRGPSASARPAGRLMHYTAYSRRPQVLMVTGVRGGSAARSDSGAPGAPKWVRVQLPRRPNGSAAWVPSDAVQLARTGLRITVSLRTKRLEVWRDGVRVRSFPAGVGTGRTPTPVGTFAIQDPVPASPSQRSYLGPYILTLTAHSTVLKTFMGGRGLVAIHGTNAPGLLGGAVSNGCVRVSNRAVTYLNSIVTPGTPVQITRS